MGWLTTFLSTEESLKPNIFFKECRLQMWCLTKARFYLPLDIKTLKQSCWDCPDKANKASRLQKTEDKKSHSMMWTHGLLLSVRSLAFVLMTIPYNPFLPNSLLPFHLDLARIAHDTILPSKYPSGPASTVYLLMCFLSLRSLITDFMMSQIEFRLWLNISRIWGVVRLSRLTSEKVQLVSLFHICFSLILFFLLLSVFLGVCVFNKDLIH